MLRCWARLFWLSSPYSPGHSVRVTAVRNPTSLWLWRRPAVSLRARQEIIIEQSTANLCSFPSSRSKSIARDWASTSDWPTSRESNRAGLQQLDNTVIRFGPKTLYFGGEKGHGQLGLAESNRISVLKGPNQFLPEKEIQTCREREIRRRKVPTGR